MIIYAKQNGAQMATFGATGTRADQFNGADIDDLWKWKTMARVKIDSLPGTFLLIFLISLMELIMALPIEADLLVD